MRGLVPAVAVVGVLLIGGLPALAITLAAQDSTTPLAAASTSSRQDAHSGDDAPRHGPPPWAHHHVKVTKGSPGKHGHEHAYGHAHAPGWLRHHASRAPRR